MNNKPDSKVEVKAYCVVRKCCFCDAMDMAYDKGDGEAEALMRCSDMGCGHQGLFKVTKYEEPVPIANNGVSVEKLYEELCFEAGNKERGDLLNSKEKEQELWRYAKAIHDAQPASSVNAELRSALEECIRVMIDNDEYGWSDDAIKQAEQVLNSIKAGKDTKCS